jgi:hypothetical protein
MIKNYFSGQTIDSKLAMHSILNIENVNNSHIKSLLNEIY